MKHQVQYDETRDLLYIRFVGEVNEEGYREVAEQVNALPEEKRLRLIVNLSDTKTPLWNRKTRRALANGTVKSDKSRTAVLGASPPVRLVAKMVVMALGQREITRFFHTEADALAWLKGEEE